MILVLAVVLGGIGILAVAIGSIVIMGRFVSRVAGGSDRSCRLQDYGQSSAQLITGVSAQMSRAERLNLSQMQARARAAQVINEAKAHELLSRRGTRPSRYPVYVPPDPVGSSEIPGTDAGLVKRIADQREGPTLVDKDSVFAKREKK